MSPTSRSSLLAIFAKYQESVWYTEAGLMLELAIPSAILELGYLIPSFVSASYIGRNYGSIHLSGFQLANLTTNLFTLSLMYGMYSACETLAPQSYGAKNYSEVGVLAIRGFLSSMVIVLPMALLVLVYIKDILIAFGQDEEASEYASQWYSIYVISFPFSSILMAVYLFLLSQNVLMPVVATELFNVTILLPLSMWTWTHYFGYQGTAAAVVTYETCGAILILLYLCIKKPYKKRCWPGWIDGFKEAVGSWQANRLYLMLGAGGILASSEWIFWETLSLGVGRLGVVPLAIHTVPTQIVTLAFLIPESIGVALSTRLGTLLPINVRLSQHVAMFSYVVCIIIYAIITYVMYAYRATIIRFIASEEDTEVIEGCERIWWKVCLQFFLWCLYGFNEGVAIALGLQWTVGCLTLVFLWLFGLPCIWYFGVVKYQSIDVVWSWLIPPYACMNVALMISFFYVDWDRISDEIREREEMEESSSDDESESEDEQPQSRYGAVNTTDLLEENGNSNGKA